MILKIINDWFKGTNKLERFWLLAKIEFKLRYYENKLGLLWALVKPISDILIYYIAFEVVMKTGIPHFVSFLFIAFILWGFFVESTSGTTAILATKKYLYEYTNMNKIEIYLSVIGSNLIGMFFNLLMFFIYFLFIDSNQYVSWHLIFLLPVILNLVILSLGVSLIISSLYVIAKDIHQIWIIIVGLGFWISPILFKLDVFRKALPGVDYVNPIAGIIINAREVTLNHHLPEWDLFIWCFIYATLFLLIGLYMLNKLGSKAAEKL
ncbi:MAG TPA: ABC transporter permease [Bacteroidia bacterium]|jgi:ABC-type polysaccharide/polyol phosphate export permease|nr:ABC transporter permease [Bacteroidia bacterium]